MATSQGRGAGRSRKSQNITFRSADSSFLRQARGRRQGAKKRAGRKRSRYTRSRYSLRRRRSSRQSSRQLLRRRRVGSRRRTRNNSSRTRSRNNRRSESRRRYSQRQNRQDRSAESESDNEESDTSSSDGEYYDTNEDTPLPTAGTSVTTTNSSVQATQQQQDQSQQHGGHTSRHGRHGRRERQRNRHRRRQQQRDENWYFPNESQQNNWDNNQTQQRGQNNGLWVEERTLDRWQNDLPTPPVAPISSLVHQESINHAMSWNTSNHRITMQPNHQRSAQPRQMSREPSENFDPVSVNERINRIFAPAQQPVTNQRPPTRRGIPQVPAVGRMQISSAPDPGISSVSYRNPSHDQDLSQIIGNGNGLVEHGTSQNRSSSPSLRATASPPGSLQDVATTSNMTIPQTVATARDPSGHGGWRGRDNRRPDEWRWDDSNSRVTFSGSDEWNGDSDSDPYSRLNAAFRQQEERNRGWRERRRRRQNRSERRERERRRHNRGPPDSRRSSSSINDEANHAPIAPTAPPITQDVIPLATPPPIVPRFAINNMQPYYRYSTGTVEEQFQQQVEIAHMQSRNPPERNNAQQNRDGSLQSERSSQLTFYSTENPEREHHNDEVNANVDEDPHAAELRAYKDPAESDSILGQFLREVTIHGRVIISRVRKRITKQYFRRGDFQVALSDFRSLATEHARQVVGVGFTGTIDNMYRLTVKQNSSFGKPTLEIRPMNKRIRKKKIHVCYKIRYFARRQQQPHRGPVISTNI